MDIISKFNLPKYVKGKSFSEASKCIADKFKDRNSPEDIATLNELQGRLQKAQEFVKAQQEARTKPQQASQALTSEGSDGGAEPSGSEPASNEYKKGGGLFSTLFGGDSEVKGPGVMGAATGALDLANMAFGKSGVDTSGNTAPPEVPSQGMAATSGAMKGAQSGMSFGPWGATIGGVVGGAAGLIGGGKAKEAAVDAQHQYASKQHNDASNSYRTGGELLANSFRTGGDTDPWSGVFGIMNDLKAEQDKVKDIDFSNMGQQTNYMEDTKAVRDAQFAKRMQESEAKSNSIVEDAGVEGTNVASESSKARTNDEDLERESNFNPSELLRYAPAAMNASQLIGLKKPGEVNLGRLTNKYDEQLVDERGLQNTVQGAVLNNRDAILSSSGGSGSAARANLVGSQLQGAKALSNAYQQAGAENRQEKRAAQNFDMNVDRANLQQSNQETNLNLEQQAAYQTNKSKLLSQLGNDLGGVGSEEMMKRFPELMGLSYDSKGKKIRKKSGKK